MSVFDPLTATYDDWMKILQTYRRNRMFMLGNIHGMGGFDACSDDNIYHLGYLFGIWCQTKFDLSDFDDLDFTGVLLT